MAYSFDSVIRYSEVDSDGKLTWIKLLDYFQDASVFHSEYLDLGVRFLGERHLAWVLNSWQICVNRMPKLCEEVTITTIPYEIRGFFGSRNFKMETKSGELLAYANSFWTLIDTLTNRPAKVLPEMSKYDLHERMEMDYCGRKLKVSESLDMLAEIPVTRQLIDTNGHVNNGRYVEIALSFLPEGEHVRELRAEYKMQAREGDILYPGIAIEEDRTDIVFSDSDKKPYATIQFLR